MRRKQFQQLVTLSTLAFGCKFAAVGLGFFVVVLIGRYLGPKGSGVYFLAYTVVIILAVFSRLGLEIPTTRYVASSLAKKDRRTALRFIKQTKKTLRSESCVYLFGCRESRIFGG